MTTDVTLRDGTPAMIWPLLPTDGPALRHAFGELSPRSRRLRFLGELKDLGPSMLHRLVDEVDREHHIALVLVALPPDGPERPVAVGRLVQSTADPATADFAVTVADDWQGRGIGGLLAAAVVRERPAEVTRLVTAVATDNKASLAMLRRLGRTSVRLDGPGVYRVEVELASSLLAA